MNEHQLHALSRFFDGEPVEPLLLLESLADPDAANYLTQWATLRAALREDDSRPSDRFYATIASVLKPSRVRWAFWGRWIGPAVAASAVIVAGITGFDAGRQFQKQRPHAAGANHAVEGAAQTRTPGADGETRRVTPPAPAAVPLGKPPGPRQTIRRSGDWPVADTRLRFDSWRETPRGGEDQ
jgi:hypothetical protein